MFRMATRRLLIQVETEMKNRMMTRVTVTEGTDFIADNKY
jgi:hypothetical protein